MVHDHGQAGDKHSMRVVVRFRPFNDTEMLTHNNQKCFQITGRHEVTDLRKGDVFSHFDAVLGPESGQEHVFREVGLHLVRDVIEGFNAGIFAYGQSGGGKTFSTMGKEGDVEGEMRGIIPRATERLFEDVGAINAREGREAASVKASMFEIYQEKVYDLLQQDPDDPHHGLHAQAGHTHRSGVSVSDRVLENVHHLRVGDAREAMELFEQGTSRRRYRCMPLNPVSSRSHAVLRLHVHTLMLDGSTTDAALYFVDLMGSEGLVSELSLTVKKETTSVNFDLLCLEKVVMALGHRPGHRSVPAYRDSVLTWVLREVLGGNSKCTVLVTCSPHELQHTATEKSLRSRASARASRASSPRRA